MSSTFGNLSLFKHGKTLTYLLNKFKSEDRVGDGHKNNGDGLSAPDEVKKVIQEILNELKDARDSLVQESRDNVIRKMEETLQQLIKVDPGNATSYQEHAKLIESFKSQMKSHNVNLSSRATGVQHPSQRTTASFSNSNVEDHFPFEDKYNDLSEPEKKCLLCFSLFPDSAELNKRELINWWIGMEFIKGGFDGGREQHVDENRVSGDLRGPNNGGKMEGEEILHKYVENGFISRNDKVHQNYRICEGVLAKLIVKRDSVNFRQEKVFGLENQNLYGLPALPDRDLENIEALININENNLSNQISSMLFKMKKVKVVHLGKWQYDKDYVIVEDIEDLMKTLKNLEHVRFLSLRGISGVVNLPDSIYKLKNLKVLDLRACHNLEFMPEGIALLDQLTHLDLSECYLLDHVPKGIARLSQLRVLKGFVITPQVESEGGNPRNVQNASSCAFHDLWRLSKLEKLCIRTRRMDFPSQNDWITLGKIEKLSILRIAWVRGTSDANTNDDAAESLLPEGKLKNLEKLELQAAPKTASHVLKLVSQIKDTKLKKLYIRGGELEQLGDPSSKFRKIEEVHLRYLHELDVNWVHFRKSFPVLTRLEIFGCPNLIDIPYDDDGVWEHSERNLPPSWVPLQMNY